MHVKTSLTPYLLFCPATKKGALSLSSRLRRTNTADAFLATVNSRHSPEEHLPNLNSWAGSVQWTSVASFYLKARTGSMFASTFTYKKSLSKTFMMDSLLEFQTCKYCSVSFMFYEHWEWFCTNWALCKSTDIQTSRSIEFFNSKFKAALSRYLNQKFQDSWGL